MSVPYTPTPQPPQVKVNDLYYQLLYDDFSVFMSELQDRNGRMLSVAEHHGRWCNLVTAHDRIVLLAPRDHGKTTFALTYILWRFYRHLIDSRTRQPAEGTPARFSVLLLSATDAQAKVLLATFRDLLVANQWLLGPVGLGATAAERRAQVAWSSTRVRLASGAELAIRAYGTSVRGYHPDLLVADDVLCDDNSRSQEQRDSTWDYFLGTLLPMHAPQVLIVGTAFHQDDLLYRLAPRRLPGGMMGEAPLGFSWSKDPALNPKTGLALWPERHSAADSGRCAISTL